MSIYSGHVQTSSNLELASISRSRNRLISLKTLDSMFQWFNRIHSRLENIDYFGTTWEYVDCKYVDLNSKEVNGKRRELLKNSRI